MSTPEEELKFETEQEWLTRHASHVWEDLTPEPHYERRSIICHDCNEHIAWPRKHDLAKAEKL